VEKEMNMSKGGIWGIVGVDIFGNVVVNALQRFLMCIWAM